MVHNLSILLWNICSYNRKSSFLQSIVRARNIAIVMLQETLTMGTVHLDGARGLMTLVISTIPCSLIANSPHCGDGVESLAVEIHLPGAPLKLYNLYITRSVLLQQKTVIIEGDPSMLSTGHSIATLLS